MGLQHLWFSDRWQGNLNFGMQQQNSDLAVQNNQGLWENGKEAEVNLF